MRYALWAVDDADGGKTEAVVFVEAADAEAATAAVERDGQARGRVVLSGRTASDLRRLARQLEDEQPDLHG